MRVIDADELINLWQGISNKATVKPDSVIDTIKKSPTVQTFGQWISVKDRLPEEGTYLVYTVPYLYVDGEIDAETTALFSSFPSDLRCCLTDYFYDEDSKKNVWDVEEEIRERENQWHSEDASGIYVERLVVAWMPLPEPPEVEI